MVSGISFILLSPSASKNLMGTRDGRQVFQSENRSGSDLNIRAAHHSGISPKVCYPWCREENFARHLPQQNSILIEPECMNIVVILLTEL